MKQYITWQLVDTATGYTAGPINSIYGTYAEALTFARLKLMQCTPNRDLAMVISNGDTGEILSTLVFA